MTMSSTYTSGKRINCVMNKKGVINYRMLKSKLEKQEIQLLIPFAASLCKSIDLLNKLANLILS